MPPPDNDNEVLLDPNFPPNPDSTPRPFPTLDPAWHALPHHQPPERLFPHLMSSYAIPLNPEMASLKTHLKDIKSEMEDITSQMEMLYLRWDTISPTYKVYTGMVSAIRRFPAEVLIRIFLYALDIPSDVEEWKKTGHEEPHHPHLFSRMPWLLASVCKKWWGIIHGTPVLWSMIHLDLSSNSAFGNPNMHPDGYALTLQSQLRHSANADLYFKAYPINADLTRQPKLLKLLFHILRHRTNRMRFIRAPYSVYARLFPECPFPRLESLQVFAPEDGQHQPKEYPMRSRLEDSGNLKHLEFIGPIWPTMVTTRPVFPWNQLTTLYLTNVDIFFDAIYYILKKASQTLVDLKIDLCPKDRDEQYLSPGKNVQEIIMPNLESLTLLRKYKRASWFLVSGLVTPSLRSLDVEGPDDKYIQVIRDFIDRSCCPLSSLRFRHSTVLCPYYIQLLRNTHLRANLRTLDIEGPKLLEVDDLLEALLEDPGLNEDPPFLSLDNLTLRGLSLTELKFLFVPLEKYLYPGLCSQDASGMKMKKISIHGLFLDPEDTLDLGSEPVDVDDLHEYKEKKGAFLEKGLEIEIEDVDDFETCPCACQCTCEKAVTFTI